MESWKEIYKRNKRNSENFIKAQMKGDEKRAANISKILPILSVKLDFSKKGDLAVQTFQSGIGWYLAGFRKVSNIIKNTFRIT